MGLQPARLKQENNINRMFNMYEHPFCKVVTSAYRYLDSRRNMYEHPFCKVVTSDRSAVNENDNMYEHPFCKVVTSGKDESERSIC